MYRSLALLLFLLFGLESAAQSFTAIWNTTEPGISSANEITIPTNALFTYNYTVDWGDGTSDTAVTGDITHTYGAPGQYTVQISGDFPAIYFNNGGDRRKIIEILSWGTIPWQSMEDAFHGCENLNFDAIDSPDLSQVTSLRNMFRECTLFNGIVNGWDVGTITDMSGLFAECENFNRPLDSWNTSAVRDMSELFKNCIIFNEPLDNWNTAFVTDMREMFYVCVTFNQNINNWVTGQVTDMSGMFTVCRDYNQPMDNWDVSQVTDMNLMFFRTNDFDQDLSNWQVGNVTNMARMFDECAINFPLNDWDVSKVTDMNGMFKSTPNFNQPLDQWDVSQVTNMANMFEDARAFDQPLQDWDVSRVENMRGMFRTFSPGNVIFNQPLNNWTTTSATNMAEMFENNTFFNQPLDNWNLTGVTNIESMFENADAFNQNIENWDVSSVQNAQYVFRNNDGYNQPLNSWTLSNATTIAGMFQNAASFNHPLVWNVSGIVDFENTFNGASSFDQDIASWDVSNANDLDNMLSNSGLSQENYDALLIAWATLDVNNDLTLGATRLEYCDGRFARQELIDDHNWTFSGDAVNCTFVLCTEITSPLDTDTQVPANSDIRWAPAPNATGYRVTLEVERGGVRNFVVFNGDVADNLDVGNVVGLSFTNEFLPGDIVFVTVVPYNNDGPATGCSETRFTVVESWVNSPDAFKITIDTRNLNTNSTNANQYRLDLNDGFPDNLSYDFSVDWGDGQYNNNVNADITHTYLVPGVYTIAIIGVFPSYFQSSSNRDNLKLISMDQWGTQVWQSMFQTFYFCENMEYNATDVPNLTQVTNMQSMFRRTYLFNSNINNWDVSNVTDMGSMFYQATIYNQPMDLWNVGNVTNMSRLFSACTAFNQNINNWNVSSAETMDYMFEGANTFDQPLDAWNVANVSSMRSMFQRASVFDQPIGNWNVANVENMEDMFSSAELFNQNIDGWNVGKVEQMNGMFQSARAFNQPLNSWDVSEVLEMRSMFASTANFDQPLNNWNVTKVVDMSFMFIGAVVFNQNIEPWNVTNVLTMRSMFQSANLFNQPLNNWDVNSVVNMEGMFASAGAFNQPLNDWNVSAVSTMAAMFSNAAAFDQPLGAWDTSSVTLMPSMFQGASVYNQNINTWNVAVVTNMQSMFKDAVLFDQPLGNWDTGEVLNMAEMFSGATNFNSDINTWNVSFVTTMEEMFRNALAYNGPMDTWNVASVTTMEGMFQGATAFNSQIDSWNVRQVGTMENMFQGATAFNQSLNSWRVTNVSNMDFMFADATSYNQTMAQWNIGSLSLQGMLRNASAFDQFLGDWEITNVTNMQDMLDNSGLSRENYDNTLIAWSEQNLTTGITLGAENVPYCDALEERQSIIDNFGWNIQQDVLDCPVPECTVLLSPEDGDMDVPVNTNLSWEPATFARGYRLEITVQPGNILINETVNNATTYEFPADFTGGEQVFVRIIPFNDEGDAIGPCAEEQFTISTDPATVPDCTALSLPVVNTTDIAVDTNFEWEPVNNADGYRIRIMVDNGGGQIVFADENVGNTTSFNPPNDLPENTNVFVTITPYNSEGDAVGPCPEETFRTEFIPVPPACTTISNIANGATNIAVDTPLNWPIVPGATGYLVIVGTTSGGIEVANNIEVEIGTTYNFPMPLQEDRNHFVTIIPYNDVGDALGCSEVSFRTGTSGAMDPPSCTSLSSPMNGATGLAIGTTRMEWNPATNATQYRITITGTANNNVTDLLTTDTFYDFPNAFVNGETVMVDIIPLNGTIEPTTACTPQSFSIEAAAPTPPDCTSLSNPINGATDVALGTTQIQWNPATNATQYRVTITGTANNNITDLLTTDTFYDFPNAFINGETVTVNITPLNGTVEPATTCTPQMFTIAAANTSPACTSLSAPLNNAINVSVSLPQLNWNGVANADDYLITVNGSVSDGNDVTDLVVTGTSHPFMDFFANGETVFVSIVPRIGGVEAINCMQESFTIEGSTNTVPDCTNLSMPLNLDIDIPVNTNISWDAAPNATGYRVRIGTESGASDLFNQDVGDITVLDLLNNLPANSEIFVFIQPYNGSVDAEFCEEERFMTAAAANLPICTELRFPEQGRTDIALNTALTWTAVGGIDGYLISIGTEAGGADVLGPLDVGLTTSHQPDSELPAGTELFVTITPYNSNGNAVDCGSTSFTTVGENTATRTTLFGFSPDGDGINDFWTINGIEEYPNNTVTIYNRWGDTVFKINGYDNAANVFRGEANQLTGLGAGELPEGTYFFIISLPENHNLNATQGYVVLKR